MSYDYRLERAFVFTEPGQEMLLRIRDNAARLLATAGACRFNEMTRGVTGDTWSMLACVDRLVERGDLVEVTGVAHEVAGQWRVFVAGNEMLTVARA